MSKDTSHLFRQHYSLIADHVRLLDDTLRALPKNDSRAPELRKMISRALRLAQETKRANFIQLSNTSETPCFDTADPWLSSDDERHTATPVIRTTPPPLRAKRTYEDYDELRYGNPAAKRRRTGTDIALRDILEQPYADGDGLDSSLHSTNASGYAGQENRTIREHANDSDKPMMDSYERVEDDARHRQGTERHAEEVVSTASVERDPARKRKLTLEAGDQNAEEYGPKRLRSSVPV